MQISEAQEKRQIEFRYRCGENIYAKHTAILSRISDFICTKAADHMYETMGRYYSHLSIEFTEMYINVFEPLQGRPGCCVHFDRYQMGRVLCPEVFMHALFPYLERELPIKVKRRFANCGYDYTISVEESVNCRISVWVRKTSKPQTKKLGSWL